MKNVALDISKVYDFVSKDKVYAYANDVTRYQEALESKTGKGSDFLGWLHLPSSISDQIITDIETTAKSLQEKVDVVVVIGIGGSYLGAKSVIEAMSHSFSHLIPPNGTPHVFFAGQNIGEDYLAEMLEVLGNKKYGIIVISKSGTTTEPAIAFRILKDHLESKVGPETAKELIVAITDANKGALRTLADQKGYKTFSIPDDVGGRFSVLTPVGLLPIAVSGFSIRKFINGAVSMEKITGKNTPFEENPAALYAAARNALYETGKKIEILANYNPKLSYIAEWWKQLYGESEGKEGKGIYPASVNLTADLHSMGQYIQEGERLLMETVISVENPDKELHVPSDEDNLDKLNYLAGKNIDYVNKMAELGTMLAHVDGGVPNIKISMPEINEFYIGQLIYFFEMACAISGYILGVNPFDQPGVEAYKKNMFALLGKPGFEDETKKIKNKLNA
ncbi:MAG: glucose-6-phosphate isomerase [Bacteroidota bacterium]